MSIRTAYNASETSVRAFDPSRLDSAKVSHVTRRIDIQARARYLLSGDITPNAGDVVLAKVETIRQHTRLELTTGRKAILFPGDEIVVCYGNRYAPDQFHAIVPVDMDRCSLVAAGGIAATVMSQHKKISMATVVQPIGLLAETPARRINVMDGALVVNEWPTVRPPTIAVFGTAMNAGKTLSAAYLVKGLKHCGLKVGAAKVTGTGAGNDTWLMRDAGADRVLDFTDAGYCSTFHVPIANIESIVSTLVDTLTEDSVDIIVLEVADGLHQQETHALLKSERFRGLVDGVIFAARDASGAKNGADLIRAQRHKLLAISGSLGASPLTVEETRAITGEFVVDVTELSQPTVAEHFLSAASQPESVEQIM